MAFILARKLEMSQRYVGDEFVPVTVLDATPCVVTQVKVTQRDGYDAVQVGCGQRRGLSKAIAGHLAGRGAFRWIREFRVASGKPDGSAWSVGDRIDASAFKPGDRVQVTGISKGKGFAGVVKRHHFHGQDATHGNKDQLRMPGSIGAGGVQHVFKGTRMAGRMGSDRVTVRGLSIIAVDPTTNRLEVKGAIPGARGTLVAVQQYGGYWG